MSNAVQVFEHTTVADAALAQEVVLQPASMQHAYRMDPSQDALLRSNARSVRNLASQHDALVPVATAILTRMSQNTYYYTASHILEEYGWFVRKREQNQTDYINRLISHYQRFNLNIRMRRSQTFADSDDSAFESLYELQPSIVRASAQPLSQFAIDSKSEQNLVHVGCLLA